MIGVNKRWVCDCQPAWWGWTELKFGSPHLDDDYDNAPASSVTLSRAVRCRYRHRCLLWMTSCRPSGVRGGGRCACDCRAQEWSWIKGGQRMGGARGGEDGNRAWRISFIQKKSGIHGCSVHERWAALVQDSYVRVKYSFIFQAQMPFWWGIMEMSGKQYECISPNHFQSISLFYKQFCHSEATIYISMWSFWGGITIWNWTCYESDEKKRYKWLAKECIFSRPDANADWGWGAGVIVVASAMCSCSCYALVSGQRLMRAMVP